MSEASPKAATLTAIATGTDDAQAVAATEGLRLIGYSVVEDAGTPATASLILRHGTTSTDDPIAFVNLAASGSDTVFLGDGGVYVPSGVFVDRVTGSTAITLYTRTGE